MAAESKWVQNRRKLVDAVIENTTKVEDLWSNRELGVSTLLAMRDEVQYLREKLAKSEKETA